MSFLLTLNDFQDGEYLKPSKPKNNEDYDYWEGSFKGYSPKELLALSDEDLQTLFNEFLNKGLEIRLLDRYYANYRNHLSKMKKSNDSNRKNLEEELSTQGGGFLRYILTKILKGIKFTNNSEVQIFRTISVKDTAEINFDNLGVCWTFEPSKLSYLEEFFGFKYLEEGYKIRFASITSQDNIDWVNSLFLYLKHAFLGETNEDELRVYDSKKVFVTGYASIDPKTNTLDFKNGDTSRILKGISL